MSDQLGFIERDKLYHIVRAFWAGWWFNRPFYNERKPIITDFRGCSAIRWIRKNYPEYAEVTSNAEHPIWTEFFNRMIEEWE